MVIIRSGVKQRHLGKLKIAYVKGLFTMRRALSCIYGFDGLIITIINSARLLLLQKNS